MYLSMYESRRCYCQRRSCVTTLYCTRVHDCRTSWLSAVCLYFCLCLHARLSLSLSLSLSVCVCVCVCVCLGRSTKPAGWCGYLSDAMWRLCIVYWHVTTDSRSDSHVLLLVDAWWPITRLTFRSAVVIVILVMTF